MQQKWEVVPGCLTELGEGPVWDINSKSILWVDILKGIIHRYFPERNEHTTFTTGCMIGAISIRENGGIIAAAQSGFTAIDLESGITQSLIDPESHLNSNRFNDGKCDPAGRFWAGTMSVDGHRCEGALYSLNTDLSVDLKIKNVTCSNGMAWSHDFKTFYYIDTPTRQVVAYDYDIEVGSITRKQVIITIPKKEGYPDGMTIDAEGMLWIAYWKGWKVVRWNPSTGQMLQSISLPVSLVTSCTFGGVKLQDLYITSARTGLSADELKRQPLAGSLFVIKNCGFCGVPAVAFKG